MTHEHRKRGHSAKNAAAPVSEVDQQLEAFKQNAKTEGETIIKEIFPKKVLELNELLDSEMFKMKNMQAIGQVKLNIPVPEPHQLHASEPVSKKRKSEVVDGIGVEGSHVLTLPQGSVHTNDRLVEIIDILKPQAIELLEHANKLKMWITYMIPKIEDGNNFGVSIQEDTMAEARQIESEAASFLDQVSRYFLTRGKIVSKVAKYPHVDDYRRTIQELDEKEFISLRLVIVEMRNHYASLNDLIVKNLDKIRKPRSTNTDNMY